MAERLALVRREPACVIDWGAALGASAQCLARAYPRARLIAVDEAAPPAPAPRRRPGAWWPWRRAPRVPPSVAPAALADGAAELLWSNMGLHWEADPEAVMRRWRRALATDGFLMFSTLGPGTLVGLQEGYRLRGWPAAMAPLVDMHDLGDMLVGAGFADPVMDQETLTLTWADAEAALAELRTMGGNAALQRHPGLRSRRWRRQLLEVLEGCRQADGRVALAFEVVHGHAFCPAPRVPVSREATVGVEQLRSMARAGKASG